MGQMNATLLLFRLLVELPYNWRVLQHAAAFSCVTLLAINVLATHGMFVSIIKRLPFKLSV